MAAAKAKAKKKKQSEPPKPKFAASDPVPTPALAPKPRSAGAKKKSAARTPAKKKPAAKAARADRATRSTKPGKPTRVKSSAKPTRAAKPSKPAQSAKPTRDAAKPRAKPRDAKASDARASDAKPRDAKPSAKPRNARAAERGAHAAEREDVIPATKPEAGSVAPAAPAPPPSSPSIPASSPSQRVLQGRAAMPAERSLTDEEREAMEKVALTARSFIRAPSVVSPVAMISFISAFLEDVRIGKREEPKSQDVRLGLGVLWGEQLRAQVGWVWVHLSYADGFASYALVPDDRAFACFPLNRVPEALSPDVGTNTNARVFDSILENQLPTRRSNTYLVIG